MQSSSSSFVSGSPLVSRLAGPRRSLARASLAPTVALATALVSLLAPTMAFATTVERPAGMPGGMIDKSRPRGTFVITPASPDEPRFGPGPKHRVLYVNRSGGTYRPGPDNSATNTSSIVSSQRTITPPPFTQAEWDTIFGCMQDIYKDFAIEVTQVEPPAGTIHIESVVGGSPADLGLDPGIGGISPLRPDCSVVEAGINFTFAEVWKSGGQYDLQEICHTIAQESAHSLGLDHEFLCQDPMTYLFGCGAKTFQNVDAPCGEYEARACTCTGTTQNSVAVLNQVLGPSDDVPPQVTLLEPAEGAEVKPNFKIKAEASDNIRVDRVELYVDGMRLGIDDSPPFEFTAPTAVSLGTHVVEVRAVDGDENKVPQAVNVTVVGECTSAEECGEFEDCVGSVCIGGVGATCADHAECSTGLCYYDAKENLRFCSQPCTGSSECPSSFACLEAEGGGGMFCLQGEGGGCACRAGVGDRGGRAGALAALLLGVGAVIVVRRRRR